MLLEVYLDSRGHKYYAKGVYSEEGLVVKKNSRINLSFAKHVKGGKKAKSFRDNPELVDQAGVVLADCLFDSPSTAAQFITGSSVNGYTAWHVDKKTTLKKHLILQENQNGDTSQG